MFPRADLASIFIRKRFGDLFDVVEIVNCPGRQQLSQRGLAQLRVHSFQLELLLGEIPRSKLFKIRRT